MIRADKLALPNAAWGVALPGLPRHMTITQAEFTVTELRRAIAEARANNDAEREV